MEIHPVIEADFPDFGVYRQVEIIFEIEGVAGDFSGGFAYDTVCGSGVGIFIGFGDDPNALFFFAVVIDEIFDEGELLFVFIPCADDINNEAAAYSAEAVLEDAPCFHFAFEIVFDD